MIPTLEQLEDARTNDQRRYRAYIYAMVKSTAKYLEDRHHQRIEEPMVEFTYATLLAEVNQGIRLTGDYRKYFQSRAKTLLQFCVAESRMARESGVGSV